MNSYLRTGDSIWGAAALANDTRAANKEKAKKEDAIAAQAKDDTAKTDIPSVRVSISGDALERAAQGRQARQARQTQQADAGQSAATGPSGSDMARGRIAEIKQRIKMLKILLAMMGPEAAKGIIQELRQLAGQLAQAAATLSQGSGGGASVGPMTAPVVHTAAAAPSAAMPAAATAGITSAAAATNAPVSQPAASRALTAYAGSAPTADGTAADAAETASPSGDNNERIDASPPAGERQRNARQRQADARLADEAMQALKALLATAEKALREDKNADGNRVADLKAKLAQAEQSARSRDADGIGPPANEDKPLSNSPNRKATKGA
ncbi:hypothetical protein ACFZAI_17615 [Achromobacter sp. NPDC008082]|uniref:hypothetical protein n=1 Tax=Achromobacter sp. NPDC008082 TaxID=3363888 RepID=UPI0036EBD281